MRIFYRSPIRDPESGARMRCELEVSDERDWAEVANFIRAKLWPVIEFMPATRAELAQVAREAEAGAKAFKERMAKREARSKD